MSAPAKKPSFSKFRAFLKTTAQKDAKPWLSDKLTDDVKIKMRFRDDELAGNNSKMGWYGHMLGTVALQGGLGMFEYETEKHAAQLIANVMSKTYETKDLQIWLLAFRHYGMAQIDYNGFFKKAKNAKEEESLLKKRTQVLNDFQNVVKKSTIEGELLSRLFWLREIAHELMISKKFKEAFFKCSTIQKFENKHAGSVYSRFEEMEKDIFYRFSHSPTRWCLIMDFREKPTTDLGRCIKFIIEVQDFQTNLFYDFKKGVNVETKTYVNKTLPLIECFAMTRIPAKFLNRDNSAGIKGLRGARTKYEATTNAKWMKSDPKNTKEFFNIQAKK